MKKNLQFPQNYKKVEDVQPVPFDQEIKLAVERGESLEQLAERIDKENTPAFYGAEFRRAYSEGIEAGSAYGYEQPLDWWEAMQQACEAVTFPQRVETFECSEEVTEEADFEIVETKVEQQPVYVNEDAKPGEVERIAAPVWNEEEKCWAFSIHRVPGYFLPADIQTTEENFGVLSDQEKTKLIYGNWNTVEMKEEPGEDLIITPLGEMTVEEWDRYVAGLSDEEKKQYEPGEW